MGCLLCTEDRIAVVTVCAGPLARGLGALYVPWYVHPTLAYFPHCVSGLHRSDKDIIKAAEFVAAVDNNKPLVNAVAGTVWFGIVAAFAYRIGTVGGTPPGT